MQLKSELIWWKKKWEPWNPAIVALRATWMAGCQVVRLSCAGASLVRRGEMGVAVLLVVRRVNYSEQLQIGRWGGGRNWSSDEKMVVDKKLWEYFNPHRQIDPTHRCQKRLVCWCLLWRPGALLLCQTPHPSSTPTFSLNHSPAPSHSISPIWECTTPLTAGHLLSIQLLIPGHRRPTAGLQPALKPGRPVLSRGLGGLPTSGSLCTAPTPPPPSPHSASSTTCSLLPKTTFSEPRTARSSFSILFAFSNTLLLYRGSRNPQSRYFVQE